MLIAFPGPGYSYSIRYQLPPTEWTLGPIRQLLDNPKKEVPLLNNGRYSVSRIVVLVLRLYHGLGLLTAFALGTLDSSF